MKINKFKINLNKIFSEINIKKSKVEIKMGSSLKDTYISVDNVPAPYRTFSIRMNHNETCIILSRIWDNNHIIRDKLIKAPIIDVIYPDPLIILNDIVDRIKYDENFFNTEE